MRIGVAFFAAALVLANPWRLQAQTPCYQDQMLFAYPVFGLAVATNRSIYYADYARGTVGILDIEQNRLVRLVLGLRYPSAIEAAGNKLYFTEFGTDAGHFHDGALSVFDLETGTRNVIATGLHYPVSLFVDPTETVYVLEAGGSGTSYGGYDRLIKFAPGSSQAAVVIPLVPSPGAVVLDSRGQIIIGSWGYAIPGGAGSLLSYAPGSTNPVTLASSLPAITDLIIDRDDNLFFAGYGWDGGTIAIGEVPNGTTNVIPLQTGLLARCLALDAQGSIYYSAASIRRLTPCHEPLIVTLTNPSSGATLFLPTNVVLAATVSDSAGTVTNLVFFDGTQQLGQAVAPPFSFHWTNPSPGPHVLLAATWDNAGNCATSPPVNVLVISNSGPVMHYVDLTCAAPVPPYTSWATAATTIQDAVGAARESDEIVVTNGIYTSFGASSARVAVTNRLSLRSVNGPQFTVIQGGSSLRCVTLASGASLSGFTLTNGSTGFGSPSPSDVYRGGGVFCRNISTVVSNCVLAGNSAGWEGGGAYGGTLINCTLTNNSARSGGGAAGDVRVSFSGGGFVGTPGCRLINCTLTGNSASNEGGGAYGTRFTSGAYGCTLINCTLTNNSSWLVGGTRYCALNNCALTANYGDNGALNCTLNNCTLTGHHGTGAAARSCTLNNCTLSGNSLGADGGTLNNCTLTGNMTGAHGGTLNNCIVYDNYYANYDGNSLLNFCCTKFSPANGVGNITNAPLFGGNLRLAAGSPCINAGNNTYVTTATDLDGRPRITSGSVDIGAYEFQGPFNDWLQQFGLATDGSADFTDTDADGLNNWQEWIAGTEATNALSALQLLDPAHNASGNVITWQSVNDRIYFLERSINLGANPAFQTLATDITGQPGTTSYTDTSANGPGPYFYRVGVQTDYQFAYTTNNGAITITGYADLGGGTIIPSTINGLPVTSIGSSAFKSKPSLTSVWIPTSVTNIGDSAFSSCHSLTTLTIGNGVNSIGAQAFSICTSLISVTLGNSVSSIGDSAFSNCYSLTSVTIPDSVTNIGTSAFSSCDRLTNVAIPSSVTSIGGQAFSFCTSLTNVVIPSSVISIGGQAFVGCTSLRAITVDALNLFYHSVAGIIFNRSQTMLIAYPAGKGGSDYTIPNSVTTIGAGAFYGCASLTSVMIPNGVTSIGSGTFLGCTGLTNITIPDGVISIGDWAFENCASLTSVTIPNNVTNIGAGTFYYCTCLTNITIPNSVTSIGVQAFQGCTSLTSVTLPNSITSIGVQAFQGCTTLTTITVPDSVTNIGDYAFNGCPRLTAVYFRGNAPTLGGLYVFLGSYPYNNTILYYLPGTTGWSTAFGGSPTALWSLPNPLILNHSPSFGLRTNAFGFIISWATNVSVVVEACTNLAAPAWSPLATNTLPGGWSYFSDSGWTNYPSRIYRVRSQ